MANLERQLTARLLAGRLDQATYQQAMADLAHNALKPAVRVDNAVVVSVGDPRAQLAVLGLALPELAPQILCAAFVMAQSGADADTLVRVLDLTSQQARTILTRT